MVASQPPPDLLQTSTRSFFLDRKAGQECQVALLWVCIQQAILGDKYGNGPLSTGTVSVRRGRSGCAVRFD